MVSLSIPCVAKTLCLMRNGKMKRRLARCNTTNCIIASASLARNSRFLLRGDVRKLRIRGGHIKRVNELRKWWLYGKIRSSTYKKQDWRFQLKPGSGFFFLKIRVLKFKSKISIWSLVCGYDFKTASFFVVVHWFLWLSFFYSGKKFEKKNIWRNFGTDLVVVPHEIRSHNPQRTIQ